MKGRIVVLDHLDGRQAAALIEDGKLADFLIDPADDTLPIPGAIYRAIAGRPVKGQNGIMLELGGGQRGFLRQARGVAPGQPLLVQVATCAEGGKASPVTTRLLFKGRYAILTPGAKGLNIARSIRDEDERARLGEIAHDAMQGSAEGMGLILRSACDGVDGATIGGEVRELLEIANRILAEGEGVSPELLLAAPSADYLAWRDWTNPDPEQVFEGEGAFADHGVLEMLDALLQPHVPLGRDASMFVESTRALVAVDVNSGGDFSFAAALKANLAAARELPRQLRLRGLGGQIVVDFAPVAKKDRKLVEQTLKRAFRDEGIDTALVGWTPLGHMELQRKRERLPLDLRLS